MGARMKWTPPTKAQEACKSRRQRNLASYLQRGLETDIEYNLLYGDRKNAALEEWERDYLAALLENNRPWMGTALVLEKRLAR